MKARMNDLTDEQVLTWLRTNIALRKQIAEHCGGYAYADDIENRLLIYATQDFVRIAKLLGKTFVVETQDDDTLRYTAKFEYLDIEILTYGYSEGEFNE